jgi:hypothetical protein
MDLLRLDETDTHDDYVVNIPEKTFKFCDHCSQRIDVCSYEGCGGKHPRDWRGAPKS